jgi:hypothetical protein
VFPSELFKISKIEIWITKTKFLSFNNFSLIFLKINLEQLGKTPSVFSSTSSSFKSSFKFEFEEIKENVFPVCGSP